MKNWFSGDREDMDFRGEEVLSRPKNAKEQTTSKEGRRAVSRQSLDTLKRVLQVVLFSGAVASTDITAALAQDAGYRGDIRAVRNLPQGEIPERDLIREVRSLREGRLVPERDDANLEFVFFGGVFRGERGRPAREAVLAGIEDALRPFDLQGDFTLKLEIASSGELGNNPAEAVPGMAPNDDAQRVFTEIQRECLIGRDVGPADRVNGRININGQIAWDFSLDGDEDADTYSLRRIGQHEMEHHLGFLNWSREVNNRVDLVNGYPAPFTTLLVDNQNRNLLERYQDGSQALLNALRNDSPGLSGPLIEALRGEGERILVDNRNLPGEHDRLSHLREGLMASGNGPDDIHGGELLDTTAALILAECGLRLRTPNVLLPEEVTIPEDGDTSLTLGFDNLLVRRDLEISATSSDEAVTVELREDDDGEYHLIITPQANWHGDATVTIHSSGWQQEDWERETTLTVHVENVNDRPEFVDAPREVSGNKGEVIRFVLQGRDEDREDSLSFTISNRGGLPEGATLTDNRDGTASFSWETTNNDAGEYAPRFRVSDGRLSREVTVNIEVTNRVPVVEREIQDQTLQEDCGRTVLIENLNDYFSDPDGDSLAYIVQGPAALHLRINEDALTVEPEPNYNLSDGAEITVTATDTDGGRVSETFRLTITPVNDAPRIVDADGNNVETVNIQAREGTELRVSLFAQDPDLAREGDSLTWAIDDYDGLPDNGPHIEAVGNGQARFVWTPGFEDAGTFNPIFVVTDRSGARDVFSLNIQVENINRAPEVTNPIGNVEIPEDSGQREIARLDTVFSDPDNEGNMTYRVSDTPEGLGLTLDENNILAINPTPNYHTPEGGVVVTVTARDGRGAETPHALTITVESVNDAPGAFDLTEGPEEGETVARDTSLTFGWNPSEDIDSDTLRYQLVFSVGDTVHTFPSTRNTEFTVADLQTLLRSLGIAEEDTTQVTWSVNVTDGQVTVGSSSMRTFTVLPKPNDVDVMEPEGLPTEFRCSAPYPNPLNGKNIGMVLELPQAEEVRFVLYDMNGRQINGGSFPDKVSVGAGISPVSLTLPDLQSGTYFVLVRHNGKEVVQKIEFVR